MAANLRIILGTMELGRRKLTEDGPCHEMLDGFLSLKYNELDTAFMYTDGKSEQAIGRYPKKSQCMIATKVNPFNPAGMKYDRVLEEMRVSLERLQMLSVDILYLHAPDHNTPIEETLSAVQKLYKAAEVEKTSLTLQYFQQHFFSEYNPTVEDWYTKICSFDGENIHLKVIDTEGGLNEYRAWTDQVIRQADG